MIIEYRGKRPQVDPSAFVAPNAVLIGDVEVGPESSIWFGAVLRGDNGPIRVGARTSIQDNAVVHVSDESGTHIGDDVTVGHCAVMEDCTDRAVRAHRKQRDTSQRLENRRGRADRGRQRRRLNAPRSRRASSQRARRRRLRKRLEGDAASWIEVAADEYVKLSRLYLAQSIGLIEDQETMLSFPKRHGSSSRSISRLGRG